MYTGGKSTQRTQLLERGLEIEALPLLVSSTLVFPFTVIKNLKNKDNVFCVLISLKVHIIDACILAYTIIASYSWTELIGRPVCLPDE